MLRKRAGLRFPFACYRSRLEQPLPSRSEPQHSRATVRLSEKGITIMMPRSVGMVAALLIVSLNTAFAQSPPPVSFFAARTFGAGSNPDSVAVGDFNGDGKPDLAVANFGSNNVSILLNNTVQAAIATLSPTTLIFGTQPVGTTSKPQPVTLTNSGSATLDITSIAARANFSQTSNCHSKMPPGGQCTLSVIFKPLKIGPITSAITVRDNASDSPQTVSLTGLGTVVTLLPSSLDFGDQPVGTTSQPQIVTLTNYSSRALSIYGIGLPGNNSGAFAQTNTCGTSVPAGGSCTISVTFAPKYKGARSATLEVGDNGGGSPQSVAVSGNGT